MRISTNQQYENYSRDIASAQERYIRAQRQVSTGKRFSSASEDWIGTAQSLKYRNIQDSVNQFRKNIQDVKANVGFSADAFDGISGLMNQAYTLAVQAANSPVDQKAREAMAAQITQIQARLVDLGNGRGPNGDYLFGGQITDAKPFTVSGAGITYGGDNGSIMVETAPGTTAAKNFLVGTSVTGAYNALEAFKTNLQGGNVGAISGVDIQALQDAGKGFRGLLGQAGVLTQSLNQTDADHQRRLDELAAGISDIEDVDMAEAAVNLQLSQTAYQAALTTAGRGFNLSLLDFING